LTHIKNFTTANNTGNANESTPTVHKGNHSQYTYELYINENRAIPMRASMSKTNTCDSGSLGFVRRPWIMRGNARLFCWSLPSWLVEWWRCCNWCNPRCNKMYLYRHLFISDNSQLSVVLTINE